jgi:hypothetical protein
MKGKREARSIDRFYDVCMLQRNMRWTDKAVINGSESYVTSVRTVVSMFDIKKQVARMCNKMRDQNIAQGEMSKPISGILHSSF